MDFSPSLIPGRLIERYKRFIATVQLDTGKIITAHCANTGVMMGIAHPGERVWVYQHSLQGKRKLGYSWELVEQEGQFIGMNTSTPMKLVREAFAHFQSLQKNSPFAPLFQGYDHLKAEVPIGNSRLDFCLTGPQGTTYLEVKNVHLKRGRTAFFPDTRTQRGLRHLKELTMAARQGLGAVTLYIIQRNDVEDFRIAGDIDPYYAQAFEEAAGVKSLAYSCHLSPKGITLGESIPILDPFYKASL